MAFVPFVESDQPTMAAFNEKFQQNYEAAVAAGVKIDSGSYVGAGSSKKTLTFGFEPKLVMIAQRDDYSRIFVVRGMAYSYYIETPSGNSSSVNLTWSGNSLSMVNSRDSSYTGGSCLDASGKTYDYVAIG